MANSTKTGGTPTRAETLLEKTTRAAKEIIDGETEQRAVKTEGLRQARLEREAADRRAAEAAADEAPLVIPEAPSGAIRDEDVAPPLHCFSASESHAPPPGDDAAAAEAATPISTSDLVRLAARLATVAGQVEQAAHDEAMRLSLHCFSSSESHAAPVDDLDQAMRDLQSEILGLKGSEPLSDALPGAP